MVLGVHACMFVPGFAHMFINVCACVYTRVCMLVCTRARVCVCTCVCVCVSVPPAQICLHCCFLTRVWHTLLLSWGAAVWGEAGWWGRGCLCQLSTQATHSCGSVFNLVKIWEISK